MNNSELIGTIGVGLILLAYFANVFSLIPKEGRLYFLLNITGAGLACYASWLILFWPFLVLEGVWCVVSIVGMIRAFLHTSNT